MLRCNGLQIGIEAVQRDRDHMLLKDVIRDAHPVDQLLLLDDGFVVRVIGRVYIKAKSKIPLYPTIVTL